jgi:hypothetical protein
VDKEYKPVSNPVKTEYSDIGLEKKMILKKSKHDIKMSLKFEALKIVDFSLKSLV